jgi:hypothetical protein
MPARKKRPDKFGARGSEFVNAIEQRDIIDARGLIKKLLRAEQETPRGMHYVGWPDMDAARRLEQGKFLVEGHAEGCFYLTDKARGAWP